MQHEAFYLLNGHTVKIVSHVVISDLELREVMLRVLMNLE
jgi:hypothetical protein